MSTHPGLSGRFVIPDVVVSHFHLREGDTVGDFGAGGGNFATVLSRGVGASGKVYLFDIQRNLIERCEGVVRQNRLQNVETLWGDLEKPQGTKLDDALLDVGLLVNTLFQLEDKPAALAEIYRVLRPGAKLFVIDWTESFGGLGPTPTDVVDEEAAKDHCEAAGFVFERDFDAADHHYGLAFRKPS